MLNLIVQHDLIDPNFKIGMCLSRLSLKLAVKVFIAGRNLIKRSFMSPLDFWTVQDTAKLLSVL